MRHSTFTVQIYPIDGRRLMKKTEVAVTAVNDEANKVEVGEKLVSKYLSPTEQGG